MTAPALLADDQLLISNGRLIVLKRTGDVHAYRVYQLLLQAGCMSPHVDFAMLGRFGALLSIATINGQPLRWPRSRKKDLMSFEAQFTADDKKRILDAFDRLSVDPVHEQGA